MNNLRVGSLIQRGVALAGAVVKGLATAKSGTAKDASSLTTGGTDNFLDLLITQITHQNPMEPMDNEAMVTQMTQMQTMQTLEELNETMGVMMLYQNLMNSINLIGKKVTVINPETGENVVGNVEGIRIENGFPGVVIDGSFYDISLVRDIE
ncbi:MAG: hypothetical protein K8T10_22315 [Candidatus Eremiobacteraeota bacterium]|nr:hypothetical protein [Candidatus Eremiobacteraeota bacterium]